MYYFVIVGKTIRHSGPCRSASEAIESCFGKVSKSRATTYLFGRYPRKEVHENIVEACIVTLLHKHATRKRHAENTR